MITLHRIVFGPSQHMQTLAAASVDLVVTSPPYPMIEMWDEVFSQQNPKIRRALARSDRLAAFELMHAELDRVWLEVYRALKPGGIACINVGDATRTINDHFALYPNHARILNAVQQIGFSILPAIIWRKQTNAPNKFMGSGMLPPGAYVTLEHEYVLVLRKGDKREFSRADQKSNRSASAYFWEERNTWFSDVWMDLKGARQDLFDNRLRKRSGAFPFELPYRLINMFSARGDMVLDPFVGLGTTTAAAMAAGRSSCGYDIDTRLQDTLLGPKNHIVEIAAARIRSRMHNHFDFIRQRFENKGGFKYCNRHYGFPVITNQERGLIFNPLLTVRATGDQRFEATYADQPQKEYISDWDGFFDLSVSKVKPPKKPKAPALKPPQTRQRVLFD